MKGDVVHARTLPNGELDSYHWSIYRGKLRLRKATPGSTTWPTVKPWRRVS